MPSFGPNTTAAIITVIWIIVKLMNPNGINPSQGTIACTMMIANKIARKTSRKVLFLLFIFSPLFIYTNRKNFCHFRQLKTIRNRPFD